MRFGGLFVEGVDELVGAVGVKDLGEDCGGWVASPRASIARAASAAAPAARVIAGVSAHRRAWKRSAARSKRRSPARW